MLLLLILTLSLVVGLAVAVCVGMQARLFEETAEVTVIRPDGGEWDAFEEIVAPLRDDPGFARGFDGRL